MTLPEWLDLLQKLVAPVVALIFFEIRGLRKEQRDALVTIHRVDRRLVRVETTLKLPSIKED